MATNLEATIAKLLAKAEGTTNPHEAEAFMAKAEELMLKHGIERAQVEAHRPGTVHKTEPIVTVRIRVADGHGYALGLVNIAHGIAPTFNVRTLQSTNRYDSSKTVWFIGHEGDVQDATTLFNSLAAQAIPQAKAWWKNEGKHNTIWYTDNDAYLARREFIFGFARGAAARLRETRNRVVAQSSAGTELMLIDRKTLVDKWIDENMQVGKGRATSRRTGGEAARSAGTQAGRDAVGNRSIGR